jgi:hypothetical protein
MTAKRHSVGAASIGGVMFTLAALAMHAKPALADTPSICVTSNDELGSALRLAQSSAVSIQLMVGAYDLKSTIWNGGGAASTPPKFFAGSSLTGGFLNATCTSQNIERDNTVITDSESDPKDGFQMLGNATIQGITFHLQDGISIIADSGSIAGLVPSSQLALRRNVFTQTVGNNYSAVSLFWSDTAASNGVIRLVNNLVYENSSTIGTGAVQLFVLNGKPTFEAVNNTIDNNGGLMKGLVLQTQSAVPVYAYNNILFGNGGLDLDITASTNVTLGNNTIGTHSYTNSALVTGANWTLTTNRSLRRFHRRSTPASQA